MEYKGHVFFTSNGNFDNHFLYCIPRRPNTKAQEDEETVEDDVSE